MNIFTSIELCEIIQLVDNKSQHLLWSYFSCWGGFFVLVFQVVFFSLRNLLYDERKTFECQNYHYTIFHLKMKKKCFLLQQFPVGARELRKQKSNFYSTSWMLNNLRRKWANKLGKDGFWMPIALCLDEQQIKLFEDK